MATRFSDTIVPDTQVDANFRAWIQFVEDTLVTSGGWVVTADTGQTLPSLFVHVATANFKVGYRIYKMNDALQATAPVFMRIDFGNNNTSGGGPQMWVTLGTGSNGSGTITGVLLSSQGFCGSGLSSTAPSRSYSSAANNRCAIALFINTQPLLFSVERTKDASGNDTSEGLLFLCSSQFAASVSLQRSIYCVFGLSLAAQPVLESALGYIISRQNPTETFAPGDVGVAVIIHFKGISQQPGINFLITNFNDISLEGNVNITLYGVTHVYQQLGSALSPYKPYAGAGSMDTSARILIRYD